MPTSRHASANAPKLDAGARDVRVTIEQLTESKGGSGYPVESWTSLVDLNMSKREVGGLERFAAAQVQAPYETRWGMEYRPDMDPDLLDVPKRRRLVVGGRTHDIVDATLVGRNVGIELRTLARRG